MGIYRERPDMFSVPFTGLQPDMSTFRYGRNQQFPVNVGRFNPVHPPQGFPRNNVFPMSNPVPMPTQNATVNQPRRPVVMPDKFDGSVGWQDYFAHFELCAHLNSWTFSQKATYLAVSLRGRAQELLGDMSSEMRQDYSYLVETLQSRFGSEGQNELFRAQLKTRQRKPDETLPELAQSIRRLIARGYPNANVALREILALDHFIDALLDSETRLRLKQNKPTSLDECVRMAIELEAFSKAEQEKFSGKSKKFVRATNLGEPNVENEQHKLLLSKISELEKQLAQLNSQGKIVIDKAEKSNVSEKNPSQNNAKMKKKYTPRDLSKVECYLCRKLGHYQSHCPENNDQHVKSKSKPTNVSGPQENSKQLN